VAPADVIDGTGCAENRECECEGNRAQLGATEWIVTSQKHRHRRRSRADEHQNGTANGFGSQLL
jgi:hypothetical protein